jgi:hypothetical protein
VNFFFFFFSFVFLSFLLFFGFLLCHLFMDLLQPQDKSKPYLRKSDSFVPSTPFLPNYPNVSSPPPPLPLSNQRYTFFSSCSPFLFPFSPLFFPLFSSSLFTFSCISSFLFFFPLLLGLLFPCSHSVEDRQRTNLCLKSAKIAIKTQKPLFSLLFLLLFSFYLLRGRSPP